MEEDSLKSFFNGRKQGLRLLRQTIIQIFYLFFKVYQQFELPMITWGEKDYKCNISNLMLITYLLAFEALVC